MLQPQVLVVILTKEIVTTAWSMGFKALEIPGTYTALAGMPYDHARNTGCLKLMEFGADYLFFLDDDVIPPPHAILQLMSHKQPIVSGLYYRRNEPIVPVMLKNIPGGRQWVTNFMAPDLIEVDYVGAGCLLIHKQVIQKLGHKPFEWRVDRDDLPMEQKTSEDFTFCDVARANGFRILVDTGIQCRHAGLSESRIPGELKPLELM